MPCALTAQKANIMSASCFTNASVETYMLPVMPAHEAFGTVQQMSWFGQSCKHATQGSFVGGAQVILQHAAVQDYAREAPVLVVCRRQRIRLAVT